MCEYCREYLLGKHDSRCPNAKEPYSIGECSICGNEIWENEKYVKFGDILYCWDCIDYNTYFVEREI